MKTVVIDIALIAGILSGSLWIFYGWRKNRSEKTNFSFMAFLRKGFKVTAFRSHTGKEMVAMGMLNWLLVLIVYFLFFHL